MLQIFDVYRDFNYVLRGLSRFGRGEGGRGRRKFFKEPAGSRASAGAWDSKARKIKGRREREREKKEAYKEVSK